MEYYDIIRYIDFAMFGVGLAFMVVTNILAFNVLRPPKRLGFLWWNVGTISMSFMCLGSISLWVSFYSIGMEPSWRTPIIFIGFLLFMIAQLVIFSVELQRFASRKAAALVSQEKG